MNLDSSPALQAQLRHMLAVTVSALEARGIEYFLSYGTALGAVRHEDLIPWDFDVDLVIPAPSYDEALRALEDLLPAQYAIVMADAGSSYELLFGRVRLHGVAHKYAHVDLFPLVGTFSNRGLARMHMLLFRMLQRTHILKRVRAQQVHTGAVARTILIIAKCLLTPISSRWLRCLGNRLMNVRNYDDASVAVNIAGSYGLRELLPRSHFRSGDRAVIGGVSYRIPDNPDGYLRQMYGDYLVEPSPHEIAIKLNEFDRWYSPGLSGHRLRLSASE